MFPVKNSSLNFQTQINKFANFELRLWNEFKFETFWIIQNKFYLFRKNPIKFNSWDKYTVPPSSIIQTKFISQKIPFFRHESPQTPKYALPPFPSNLCIDFTFFLFFLLSLLMLTWSRDSLSFEYGTKPASFCDSQDYTSNKPHSQAL